MNKIKNLNKLRRKMKNSFFSIGSWMQISNPEIGEILSNQNYDWIVLDLEHGSIATDQITNVFRSIEINNKLPFARLNNNSKKEISEVLDAGAAGIIFPKIEDENELKQIISHSYYPNKGRRGIGFSRGNQYGDNFRENLNLRPFIVAMIETKKGLKNLDKILKCKELDAILIGPYDLSASLGIIADFKSLKFKKVISDILNKCKFYSKACGIHIVEPDDKELKRIINKGFLFIPFGMDTIFLKKSYKI